MENKHTPGPWHDRVNEFGQQCIYNPDTWVATCKTPANARLIAAAPEMLGCLKSLADIVHMAIPTDDEQTNKQWQESLNAARAAIEKATNGN